MFSLLYFFFFFDRLPDPFFGGPLPLRRSCTSLISLRSSWSVLKPGIILKIQKVLIKQKKLDTVLLHESLTKATPTYFSSKCIDAFRIIIVQINSRKLLFRELIARTWMVHLRITGKHFSLY